MWLFFFLFPLSAFAGPPGAVGDLYAACDCDTVSQYDGATLEWDGTLSDSGEMGGQPRGLTFGPNGNLFATGGFTGNQVVELDGATGALVRVFADVGSGTSPWGLTFGPGGNLYVACYSTNEIREFDGPTGALVGVFASGPELEHPFGLSFGPNGNLFVAPEIGGGVLEYDGSTGAFVGVFAAVTGSGEPLYDVVFGPSSNLFVGIGGGEDVARLAEFDGSTGDLIEEFGVGGICFFGGLCSPLDLAFGPNGHLYVAEPAFGPDFFEFDITTHQLIDTTMFAACNPLGNSCQPIALTFKPPCPAFTPLIAGFAPAQTADNCGILFGTTLTGTGLARGCAEVKLTKSGEADIIGTISGGLPLESIEVDFDLSGAALGLWDLVLTYPDGQLDSVSDALEILGSCPSPTISQFSPAAQPNCGLLAGAVIIGDNFIADPAPTVTLVRAGQPDISGTIVDFAPPTTIIADFDLFDVEIGAWVLLATNPDGQSATLSGALEISSCQGPEISGFSPGQSDHCASLESATITGAAFLEGSTAKLTRAGQPHVSGTNVAVLSAGTMTADFDITMVELGLWDVVVTHPGGLPCMAGMENATITVSILTDDFGEETTWDLLEQGVGLIASGGPYPSNTQINEDISVCSSSCYTFTIFDEFGDGICCFEGKGHYSVSLDGEEVASGGEFGTSETTENIACGPAPSDILAEVLEVTSCPPPQITEFSPGEAQNCNWLIGTTLTGDLFTPGMSLTLSQTGEDDIPGSNVEFLSSSTAAANFNLTAAAPGLWDLTVTRPDGMSADLADALEVSACQPPCLLFGDAEFPVEGRRPDHPVLGDLDGDGDLDLVVGTAPDNGDDNAIIVLLSDGAGTFAAGVKYTVGLNPVSARLGDLDGDGDLDLAVANLHGSGNSGSNDEEVSILFNNGDGTFGGHTFYPAAGTVPQGLAMADLDGDGDLDLAMTHRTPHGVYILLNNGDGTFAPGADHDVIGFVYAVQTGDLDGDGDLDLAVVNGSQNVGGLVVLLNNGDATFESGGHFLPSTPFRFGGGRLAVGDLDGDNDLDVAMPLRENDLVALFFNDGSAGFDTITLQTVGLIPTGPLDGDATGVALGDVDGDSDLDLAVTNEHERSVSLLLNQGDGTFTDEAVYNVGSVSRGVAMAPVDGDSSLDIVVAHHESVSVLANNGDGTFQADVTYPADDRPWDVATADFDDDGDLDLVVVNYGSNNVSVLLNSGDGTYAAPMDFPVGGQPRSVAVGDWDGDGNLDLAVANSLTGEDDLSILLGNGDGTFAPEVQVAVDGLKPWPVAAADLNADGNLDLVTANRNSSDVSVHLSAGDGTFGIPLLHSVTQARALAIADLDGDGDFDLAVGRYSDVEVLLNNGDATFVSAGAYGVDYTPFYLVSVASGDLDDDGDFDLVLAGGGSTAGFLTEGVISVLLNNGDATFAAPVTEVESISAGVVAIADLDGDSALDLAILRGGTFGVSVIRGAGDGSFKFSEELFYGTGLDPRGLAIADLDGDGWPDLAVANYEAGLLIQLPSVSVLLNRGCGLPTPCPADLDGSGDVRAPDLAMLLGSWGPCDDDCPADLDDSGAVGAFDLALLLGAWGDCG